MGPRAPWEGTGQPLTPDGKLMGWRHTGMDQLAYAFDDIVRGVEAGIRSILNFAPVVLTVPEGVEVRKVDLAVELQILAFHEQRRGDEPVPEVMHA